MRGWIFLFLGVLTVAGIIYKIIVCASCEDDFLDINMSGYAYLGIQILFAIVLLNGAYRDLIEAKRIEK